MIASELLCLAYECSSGDLRDSTLEPRHWRGELVSCFGIKTTYTGKNKLSLQQTCTCNWLRVDASNRLEASVTHQTRLIKSRHSQLLLITGYASWRQFHQTHMRRSLARPRVTGSKGRRRSVLLEFRCCDRWAAHTRWLAVRTCELNFKRQLAK